MLKLDRTLTWNPLTHAAAVAVWQVVVGMIAVALAYVYVQLAEFDPKEEREDLAAKSAEIFSDLREHFCGDGDSAAGETLSDLDTQARSALREHGATILFKRNVDGLPVGGEPPETKNKPAGKSVRNNNLGKGGTSGSGETQSLCLDLSRGWTTGIGGFDRIPSSPQRYIYNGEKQAVTSWTEVTLREKDGPSIAFIEKRPLEGWPRWIALGTGAGIVAAVLWISVVVNSYLGSRLDRLSEFGRRMDFVLHDLRHNLERIRLSAGAVRTIDLLACDSERLIEAGRLIANIHQEPVSRVDLRSLLATAAEDVDAEIDCPDGLIVRVPPQNFGSAITNLLHNAEEHGSSGDAGSRIELGVSVRQGRGWLGRKHDVIITVVDNGPGTESPIERSENIHQAIERLQRERDTNRRRGLGLLSVLYTVKECGGRFALLNRGDGKSGTAAEIVLPAEMREPKQ